MKYCPKCETVYDVEVSSSCAACGEVLLSLDALPPEELENPVILTWCPTAEEAMVLKTVLVSEGIESMIEEEGLLDLVNPSHVNPNERQGVRVLVHLKDAAAALEVLREKQSGELRLGEEDIPAAEGEEEPADPQVLLTRCSTLAEAMVLKSVLENEDIPAQVPEERLRVSIAPFDATNGDSTPVTVRAEDIEAAREILRKKEAGELRLSDDEDVTPEEEQH